MKFDELTVHTTTSGSEAVSGVLFSQGVTCFSVEDPRDLDELLSSGAVPIDYVEEGLLRDDGDVIVRIYLAQNEQGAIQREGILAGLKKLKNDCGDWVGTLETNLSVTDEKDWENNWKQFFHPLYIGQNFLVMPSWEKCDPDGRTVIEIDPASSFGTGRHETTALCLEAMEGFDLQDKKVLDMGCGSGILGIGAAKLGASRVDCIDIDQNASRIANENGEKNGISTAVMEAECGNVLTDKSLWDKVAAGGYDLILANIVADVISEMLPLFFSCLKDDGNLICSGIIKPRQDFVLDALESNGFCVKEIRERNEWVAIVCQKK